MSKRKIPFRLILEILFSDLKSRLLITIGQNTDKTLDLIIDMYYQAADCMQV